MRKALFQIHLWTGIGLGLYVVLICVTGSILVFIPLMGEYVIPSLLGLGKVFLIGNVLQLDFLGSRNWPAGSAKAVALIVIMLITVTFYLWSTNRGRATRDVSVL